MFPQVASKFFSSRAEGPKNVGKVVSEPDAAAAKPADGKAKPADGKGPITSPVTYEIKVGEKSHKVTVQPA
jgi:methylmalonyl-CoA carboxyltransferase 5S subunit